MNRNYQFYMKTDVSKYKGEWIAINNNKIIASGKDVKKVVEKAREKYPNTTPFIALVRGKEAWMF